MDWYVANPDLSEDGVMAFYWVETWSSTKIASHLPVIRNLVVLCCQKEVMMNAQISSLGGETILALGVSKQMSWTRQLPDTFTPGLSPCLLVQDPHLLLIYVYHYSHYSWSQINCYWERSVPLSQKYLQPLSMADQRPVVGSKPYSCSRRTCEVWGTEGKAA